jgi:hypothetical protein
MKEKVGKKSKKKKPIYWRNLYYQTVYFLADSPFPEIVVSFSLVLSRWWLNSDFSYPSEIWFPIIMFSLVSTLIYYGFKLIFGKGSAAHFAAILSLYGFYDYANLISTKVGSLFLNIIPSSFRTDLTQSIVVAIFILILSGILSWAIRKLISLLPILGKLQVYKVLFFAVVFIFTIQVVRSGERYFSIHKELSYQYPKTSLAKPPTPQTGSKPDVYFLMPEDYASAQTLKNVNNYNNTGILKYLSSQGFTNRQPVFYSNYPFTMSSLSSTLAMNYFPQFQQKFGGSDWQTAFPYRSVIKNPPIAQVLKQNGYSYNQVSSWWDFSRIGINSDTNPSKGYQLDVIGWHYYLSDLDRDILNKSIVSPWLKKGISVGKKPVLKYEKDYNPRENLTKQISAIKKIAGRQDKSAPQFTFGHFMVPHTPFIFNADGSDADYDSEHNDNGAQETVKYTNQVSYFNSQLKDMIGYIRQHDPDAVVMVQSDEGSYPPEFRYDQTAEHFYNPINLPDAQKIQKFSILASYYMPGQDKDKINQQIGSPVNSFRFLLNNYLGYDVQYLPDCNFATGNKFKVYNYQLVTDKLTGKPADAACKKYE